ncbi:MULTISPECIES: TadE/TadG family type IV pilus assembly protein [Halocynthiibacter]|uniref:Pilus assembly protein n=1 Tax=Halocynthiibacter halioticoli TaxID=2986804 RepID=A0AAE3IYN6_9RHOB|nr:MULTISPECIES: TadE family protein [Halocynthiibacter]MCV6824439.1 pilus assembly protein [Halocynthiibacter halioticoli]MCW4057440.1 pilus assembly protein [Halocynthiibacter sp. SDUM655004]
MNRFVSHILRRFWREERGAALVEFAIMLPMMLLFFAVIIEGGRLMWSYQAVASGVRDAARYLARVTPRDICLSGGNVGTYTSDLEAIIRQSKDGSNLFPSGITVTSVTPSLSCVSGTYRNSPAPVTEVTANLTVTFPFASVFSFAGGTNLVTINTTISDQSRVFGT